MQKEHAKREAAIDGLLERMTLEEKLAQLGSVHLDRCLESDRFSATAFREATGGAGIGVLHNVTCASAQAAVGAVAQHAGRCRPDVVNAAQEFLTKETRLGIPAIVTAEGIHGHMSLGATVFPHSIAMACSWDPALLRQAGTVVAKEAREAGVAQVFAPVLDLAREPRWGRTQETYGEDPYLVERLGVAFIKGLQGDGPAIDGEHIAATPKHFVGYGSPEGGINIGPLHAGPRELRELHLPPFEAAVREAGAASLMPSYNEVDGIPMACSNALLTRLLRDEWGFEGYTYSDWGSIDMLHAFHRVAADMADAGRQAIEAGLDLEAPVPNAYGKTLADLVRAGRVAERVIDTAVRRVLRVKFRLGLFENPYVDTDRATIRNCLAHRELAYRIAAESIVLLKNEGNLLPLSDGIRSIAVIGPNADEVQLGNYSGSNDTLVSLLAGIRNRAPEATAVSHVQGCGIYSLEEDGIPEAVAAASRADVAIVALGESCAVCEEGVDQSSLELPGAQQALLRAVQATGTPVVVVLIHGRPLSIEWAAEHVPAIVDAWFPGQEGGNALADVLFGNVNPSGKLPVSIPRSVGHLPCFYNHKPSARGYYKKPGAPGAPGRDYVFSKPTSRYPFGHGLSYTAFGYSDLRVEPDRPATGGEVTVRVTVTNRGARTGAEVVQLYLTDLVSSVTTPVKTLRRFEKVRMEPGASKTLTFTLGPRDMRLLNADLQWVVEPGEFEVSAGDLKKRFDLH